MAQHKVMDNLAKDAAAALKADMSYGKWKALHPYTKDKEEEPPVPEGCKICKHCGKAFKPRPGTSQVYCEVWCQKEAQRKRDRERKRKRAEKKRAKENL